MRILVTGGFGYLGSHISNHFLNKGHEVKILSRTTHPELSEWSQQFEKVIGDVSEYSFIENCCLDTDVVIHTAALNEVECRLKHKEALLVNGLGTRNLLEDAYRNNVKKFIYFSTFHVYGIPKTGVITEETPPDPIDTYSITHYLAERYCRQFEVEQKVKSYILRISNGYGAPLFRSVNRWTLVLNDLCSMAFSQKKIVLKSKGTQERDFVGIKDIMQGVEVFVERDIEDQGNNVYNLGSGQNISIISLANAVAEVYKERYNKSIKIEIPEDAAEPDIKVPFQFSIGKIKKLGYQPISVMKEEICNIFKLLEG
ncbi:MAG: SDR family oxidoreductase [Dehalococcoidia bacterium]|nr:MAG: SDR family oxidoreductase [Dehalococcoidia bacterium]